MTALDLTRHAQVRMAQRGLSADDLDLLMQVRVDIPDGYFATRKGCAELIRQLKQIIGSPDAARQQRPVDASQHRRRQSVQSCPFDGPQPEPRG